MSTNGAERSGARADRHDDVSRRIAGSTAGVRERHTGFKRGDVASYVLGERYAYQGVWIQKWTPHASVKSWQPAALQPPIFLVGWFVEMLIVKAPACGCDALSAPLRNAAVA